MSAFCQFTCRGGVCPPLHWIFADIHKNSAKVRFYCEIRNGDVGIKQTRRRKSAVGAYRIRPKTLTNPHGYF